MLVLRCTEALALLGVCLLSLPEILPELIEARSFACKAGLLKQAKLNEKQLDALANIAQGMLPQIEKIQGIIDGLFQAEARGAL